MKKIKFLPIIFCLITVFSKAQEVNKAVLDSIIKLSERTNSNALMIYKGNRLLYENYFGNPGKQIEAMSATKSIVSIAIGILLEKKLIDSLNQPVYTIYPEWNQGNKKHITIKHLLEHTSGIQNLPHTGYEIEIAPDVIQLALCAELDGMPGSRFSYNNKSSNLLTAIIEKTSGLKIEVFLKKYLFAEMGIKHFKWRTDSKGNPYGMAGLLIHPKDLAKIGLLLLNKGNWNGKQLVSKRWIDEMFTPSQANNNFGYQWWLTYEQQFISIDDEFLNSLKNNTDENTLRLIEKLKGNYNAMKDVREKAKTIYSTEELKSVGKIMSNLPADKWKIINAGKILHYAANGYLGQYLIIMPGKNLVIVRMIDSENFKKIPNNSGFENLPDLANGL